MPGMGGFSENVNFINNCKDWADLYAQLKTENPSFFENFNKSVFPRIRLAPITGAVENVGWTDEKSFYFEITEACFNSGILLSIGDGCPDEKLINGIEAIKFLQDKHKNDKTNEKPKAVVFIKPYPNQKILERIEWARPVAECIGVDIDSYNILTMRNLVKLERKTPSQLKELKTASKVPFAVKGVFTKEDVELVKEVKPDIVVISNHGGRVENRLGSTAKFLQENAKELKNCCGELWVDGGIRTKQDLQTASFFGVSQIMIARPLITALCKGGQSEIQKVVENFGVKI